MNHNREQNARSRPRTFRDLPIGLKASALSALLVLCLGGLGTYALLVMESLGGGLRNLTGSDLPRQHAVLAVKSDAFSTHMNVYRYVAWASSGVNPANLSSLAAEIGRDGASARAALAGLAARPDLPPDERARMSTALAKWERYATAVADTLEIATTDPALGTMMLGGTDEDYKQVATDLDAIAADVSMGTKVAAGALALEADHSQRLIAAGGLLAVLLTFAATAMVIRSVVRPIEAVTRALHGDGDGDGGKPAAPDLPETDRRDEIGQMVNAIARFRDQIAHDNRLLAAREHELMVQNMLFDAALNNMTQGLAMFDGERRLIVCNALYAQIYGVPPALVRPGTTQVEILRERVRSGVYAGSDPEAYIASRIRIADTPHDSNSLVELSDGRTIAVAHRAMPGGGWVSTHEDATERRKAEQRIAHMARHDALTSLPNRMLFREEMERVVAQAGRGEVVAILCIDLDQFKEINDTLGHPAGDQLLVMVADRLRRCVRPSDIIARLGGDEFAVIQRAIGDLEEVANNARKIVAALGEPYQLDGLESVIGASIGIAIAPGDSTDADQLLRNADVALYRAKNDGRRTYRFFEPSMDMRLQARHKLETELRRALQHNELVVYYQPVVDLRTGSVNGFEALLRWNHPERGIVLPGEFIPFAEEIGLIGAVGDWVLRHACADAARWPAHFRLAVNLSPAQFRQRTILASLHEALAASGLDPRRLELEITESVLLQDNESTILTLHALRELGARISLDDFGTGYSSLSYLIRFPFDKIKIDRSFVKDVGLRADCDAIVRAVVTLAASLGMATTAEGVETPRQRSHLRGEGCTEAQGFLFSVPLPAAELGPFLAEPRVGPGRERPARLPPIETAA
ncbi:MAG: EAL domain-containing protein [Casimicrobiaceae bacterium]